MSFAERIEALVAQGRVRREIESAWLKDGRFNGFLSEREWKGTRAESMLAELQRIPDSRWGEEQEARSCELEQILLEVQQ